MRFCFRFALLAAALWCGPALAAKEKHPGMLALAQEMAAGDSARQSEIEALLQTAEYQPAIIAAMTRPAEAKPWFAYRPIFMTEERISQGVAFYQQHRALLEDAEQRYQVPAEYIVSIIGVETYYGRVMGSWKVLDALTTLALYYPPRAPYFRGELVRFLNLPAERGIELDLSSVKGSYAGAMGLGQFMPTSFVRWAIDADGDGRIDLWASHHDAFASVANYLRDHGWAYGEPVTAALVAGPGARRLRDTGLDPVFPFSQLVEWGYQPLKSNAIEPAQMSNLLALEVAEGEFAHHAIFGNFRVITRYNRSPLYAMAVHELAQAVRSRAAH